MYLFLCIHHDKTRDNNVIFWFLQWLEAMTVASSILQIQHLRKHLLVYINTIIVRSMVFKTE